MDKTKRMLVIGLTLTVLPVLIVLTDFLVFNATAGLYGRDQGPAAYLGHRLGAELPGQRTSARPGGDRDFDKNPLRLFEKPSYSEAIDTALPQAPQGWTRRAYREEDYYTLFPHQLPCRGDRAARKAYILEGGGLQCPEGAKGLIGEHVQVYEKGSELIAIRLRYERDKRVRPEGRIKARSPLSGFVIESFTAAYMDSGYYHPFVQRGAFKFGAMKRVRRDRNDKIVPMPWRIHAAAKQDGAVDIFVVSNASKDAVRTVLNGLDLGYLHALLAPIPAEV